MQFINSIANFDRERTTLHKKFWNDEKQVYPLVTEIWTSTQLTYEKN